MIYCPEKSSACSRARLDLLSAKYINSISLATLLVYVLLSCLSCTSQDSDTKSNIQLTLPQATSYCNAQTEDLVSHMYACAFSYPETFSQQLLTKPGYTTDASWMNCAAYLVQRLRAEAAIMTPSQTFTDVVARAGSTGGGVAAGLALDVINDAQSPGASLSTIADQLEYITSVTAGLLNGQISQYQSPFPAQLETWQQLRMSYPEQQISQERNRLYQGNYQIVKDMFFAARR